jgi:hypothetical protein
MGAGQGMDLVRLVKRTLARAQITKPGEYLGLDSIHPVPRGERIVATLGKARSKLKHWRSPVELLFIDTDEGVTS